MAETILAALPRDPIHFMRTGELIGRYRLADKPGSDNFDVEVAVGELAPAYIAYDPEPGEYAGQVASAAVAKLLQGYNSGAAANQLRIIASMNQGVVFAHKKTLVLPRLQAVEDIASVVEELTDNKAFKAAGQRWEVSVVGLEGMRAMQRRLFTASGAVELDTPVAKNQQYTHPQLRAKTLNTVAAIAIDGLFCMPSTPPQ